MTLDDVAIHLPPYLSVASKNAMLDALREFPKTPPADKFYTFALEGDDTIFQGDGLTDFILIQLPESEQKRGNVLVFSNTCDVLPENDRIYPSNIVYAPIISMDKYTNLLGSKGIDKAKIEDHIDKIRKQMITQILFLPAHPTRDMKDSIVFLDTTLHVNANFINRKDLKTRRIFTLSNYGHYLFLFKISFHFSRLQDKVDRIGVTTG